MSKARGVLSRNIVLLTPLDSAYVPTDADLQRRYELLVYVRAVRTCPRCGAQRPVAEFVDLLGRMCRGCRDRLASPSGSILAAAPRAGGQEVAA